MKALLLTAVLAVSGFANGNNPERYELIQKIEEQAVRIYEDARFSRADNNQLQDALQKMQNASRILRGLPGNPVGHFAGIKCYSKFNNGFAPYVFGYLNDQFEIVKLGASFHSADACEEAMRTARSFKKFAMYCSSAFNNGFAPFTFYKYENKNVTRMDAVKFHNYDVCLEGLNSNVVMQGKVPFCSSAFNNGFAPFSISTIDKETGEVIRSSSRFPTLEQCKETIGQK